MATTFDPETEAELAQYRDAMARKRLREQGADIVGVGETIGNAFRAASGSPAIAAADRILGARGPQPEPLQTNFAERLRQEAGEPLQEWKQGFDLRQAFQKRAAEQAKAIRENKALELKGKLTEAQVGEIERKAKEAEAKAAEDALFNDKTSDVSQLARTKLRAVAPNVVSQLGTEFETMSAAALEKYAPDALRREGLIQAAKEGELNRASREKNALIISDARTRTAAAKAAEDAAKAAATEQRQIEAEQRKIEAQNRQKLIEINEFSGAAELRIKKLEELIDKAGTYELTGPEGKEMAANLHELAIASAKLADPGSVAREGEVASEKSKLWDPEKMSAAFMRDKTALQLLEAYKERLKERKALAYKVRGLSLPGAPSGQTTPSGKPFARMQRSASGATRWLDAEGNVIESIGPQTR